MGETEQSAGPNDQDPATDDHLSRALELAHSLRDGDYVKDELYGIAITLASHVDEIHDRCKAGDLPGEWDHGSIRNAQADGKRIEELVKSNASLEQELAEARERQASSDDTIAEWKRSYRVLGEKSDRHENEAEAAQRSLGRLRAATEAPKDEGGV